MGPCMMTSGTCLCLFCDSQVRGITIFWRNTRSGEAAFLSRFVLDAWTFLDPCMLDNRAECHYTYRLVKGADTNYDSETHAAD